MVAVPHVYIPIRAFRDAKRRLAPMLDPAGRRTLATALASHTAAAVRDAGACVTIVSSSPDVGSWAAIHRINRLPEAPRGGLNGAARVAVAHADGRPWFILHSDLPLLRANELSRAFDEIATGHLVMAPSYDGGTTAIGGCGPFEFSYGPASAHRHLSTDMHIVSTLGFQLDVDRPGDLVAALHHPRGRWLKDVLTSAASAPT